MLSVLKTLDHPCVSLAQVKAHLRLDHCDDDDYLSHLIKVATTWVEEIIESPLLETTYRWQANLDNGRAVGLSGENHRTSMVILPKQQVTEIISVESIDKLGQHKAVSYKVTKSGDRTALIVNSYVSCIDIEFTAGLSDKAEKIPAALKQVILNHVACHYDCRTGIKREDYSSLIQQLQSYRKVGLS